MSETHVEDTFYRSLVNLSVARAPEELLAAALSILIQAAQAREVYVELWDEQTPRGTWWRAAGCDEARVDVIRNTISTGIVSATIAAGKAVVTASAVDDERFRDYSSVRENAIESVLCVPIGAEPVHGVVYLQGKQAQEQFEPFPPNIRERVELFARVLAPHAELLLRRAADETAGASHFDGVIAASPMMKALSRRLRGIAGLDVDVLLTGASGSGKTLLARSVHEASRRAGQRFVELNCAAIPETLLESELFGADAGAHSTAPRQGSRGKVEAAEGGTLFLDEVAELSLVSQAKLLQLLGERTYYRLGSSTPRKANVRVIAATHADLGEAMRAKRFREDLYYRLKVLEERVPSLAERPEDVVPLAAAFLREAAKRHDVAVRRLAPGARLALQQENWPGNVRELAHRVEAATLAAHLRGGDQVEARDLAPASDATKVEHNLGLHEATRAFQRTYLAGILDATDWNVTEAARRMGVARSYAYTLMRALGLQRSA